MHSSTPLPGIGTPYDQKDEKGGGSAIIMIQKSSLAERGTTVEEVEKADNISSRAGPSNGSVRNGSVGPSGVIQGFSTAAAASADEVMKAEIEKSADYNKQVNAKARQRAHIVHIAWVSKSRAAAAVAAYNSEADAEGETDDELPVPLEKKKADSSVEHQQPSNQPKSAIKRNAKDDNFDAGYESEQLTGNGSEEEVEYVPRPTRSRGVKKPDA